MISYWLPISAVILALLMVFPVGLLSQTLHPEPVGLRPDAPIYAKHGPYWVGTQEFVIEDPEGSRTLPATLWYPALNPKSLKEAYTFTYLDSYHPGSGRQQVNQTTLDIEGHALVEAAPDPTGGPFPLLVFVPGDEESRLLSLFLQEHAASYGFMVLGVDHPRPGESRPGDVIRVIEFAKNLAATAGPFSGLIRTEQAAVAGVGSGGTTALQMGGIPYADKKITEPRIKALLPMTLWGDPELFDLSEATLPTLMLLSTSRKGYKTANVKIYQDLPVVAKGLVVLVGGVSSAWYIPNLPGTEGGSLDINRAHDLINHFTTAFLLDVLKGDKEAHKALLPEAVKFEEVQYTTTFK